MLSGGAEDVLVLKPDIVVASLFDKRATRELLKAKGLHLAELAVPRTLAEARHQIREVGDITGHPDRAAAEIARLDAALARARRAAAEQALSRAAAVAARLGRGQRQFCRLAARRNRAVQCRRRSRFHFGGFASLEAIVSLRPDFIVVSQAGNHASDDGQAFLLHPALERFYPAAKRIVIPERMTECGGVMLADALDALMAELKRVGR